MADWHLVAGRKYGWGLGGLVWLVAVAFSACGDAQSGSSSSTEHEAGAGGEASGSGASGGAANLAGSTGEPGGEATSAGSDTGDAGQPHAAGAGGALQLEALAVVATDPSDAALDAEPDGDIVVQFNRDVDPTSVSGESVTLRDVFLNTAVPSELELVGDTLTITPEPRLGLVAEYEVTIAQSVTDLQGIGLEQDATFSFMVRDGVWHEQPLTTGQITSLTHTLGIDDANTVFAGWVVYTNDDNAIAYCPTTARRIPLLGEPDDAVALTETTWFSDCRSPRAAAGGIGLGAASWEEDTGTWVSQYRGDGWVTSETPLTEPPSTEQATLTVLPDGTIHLLTGSHNGLLALHTDAAGKWHPTTAVLTSELPRSSPAVAFDAAGNGFAAWRSRDVDFYEMILVSRYLKEQGTWSPAAKLPGSVAAEANNTHYRGAPNLALNTRGEVMVVWARGAATGSELYASRFTNDAWENPTQVSAAVGGLTFQEPPGLVAVGGDFVLAWNQTVGAVVNTYTARFTAPRGWSDPDLQSDGLISGVTRMPRLGVDEHHNLLLVWPRTTQTEHVYDYVQARYVNATSTWYGPTAAVDTQITDSTLDEGAPDYAIPGYPVPLPFAMAKSGVAALTWASRPAIAIGLGKLENPTLGTFR